MQDKTREAENAQTRAQIADEERQKRLTHLVLRRTALSASEAVLLREVFDEIFDAHQDRVWSWLRRRGLEGDAAEDLLQEAFLALYNRILEQGFPDNVAGMLHQLTEGKFLNQMRASKRTPVSLGLPSSSSEKPRSEPDIERALDLRQLAWGLLPKLLPEHQAVMDKVVLNGLSHGDAAAALELPEGTVKSRLIAAKRELIALAEKFLPPSQRGTT